MLISSLVLIIIVIIINYDYYYYCYYYCYYYYYYYYYYLLFFPVAWFTSTRLSHLFVTMKSILQFLVKTSEICTQNDKKLRISDVFRKLVQITGALYYASGWISLQTELCQFLVFLVSIPWLWKMNPPWMDVPSAFGWTLKTMSDISVRMKDILDIDIQNECLQLLAVFPGEVSPTWRSHVFTLVLVSLLLDSVF